MNFLRNPAFLLRFAIAAGYLIIGLLLLIYNKRIELLGETYTIFLGVLMFAYGIFRAYRAYQMLKEDE